MDASTADLETMTETELRELLRSAQAALDRLVAKRARSTLKEAKRMAAEVGYELTFIKTPPGGAGGKAKPQSSRAKVLPKYRNPDNPEEAWSGRGACGARRGADPGGPRHPGGGGGLSCCPACSPAPAGGQEPPGSSRKAIRRSR